jgi:hypothetical protein
MRRLEIRRGGGKERGRIEDEQSGEEGDVKTGAL